MNSKAAFGNVEKCLEMQIRDRVKTALRGAGLFPLVRTAYRYLSPEIRAQRHKERQFYSTLLKPAGLCFDVGANLGQRTEIFLELGQRSVLIEPNSNCWSTLNFLFGRNPSVDIVPKAIGATQGEITFYSHGTDSTASVLPDWDSGVFGSDRGQIETTVPMATLDYLISTYGLPDFTKIDVEGFETEVLKGLSIPLPLISFEYHFSDMAKIHQCLSILKKLAPLTIRAASMDCDWLTERTSDTHACLQTIEAERLTGDLFVWTS